MGEDDHINYLPELKNILNENTIESVYTLEIPCNLDCTVIIMLADGRKIAIDPSQKNAWRWFK